MTFDGDVLFHDLLEFGYFPKEMPPVFTSSKFGEIITRSPNRMKGFDGFNSKTIRFDYLNYSGKGRMLGVIHPISYTLLSQHISSNWKDIHAHLSKSSQSKFPIQQPTKAIKNRRAFASPDFRERAAALGRLRSTHPFVLQLDINRFYGSIYTHSLPWALLGKRNALDLHAKKELEESWSGKLDKLTRACEKNQTIGLPIGPDTSRILSEIVLSGLNVDLEDEFSKNFGGGDFFHVIDDYYFGASSIEQCDEISAKFEKNIRNFELRTREDKRVVLSPSDNTTEAWKWKMIALEKLKGIEKIEGIFEIIFDSLQNQSESNVLAYFLRRFGKEISVFSHRDLVLQLLQRTLFAGPHLIPWIAPFIFALQAQRQLSEGQLNVLRYGLTESARKHDIVSILWYLYLYIGFREGLDQAEYKACLDMDCPLIDLMLAHAIELDILKGDTENLRSRHREKGLETQSWIFLYETELRNWKVAPEVKVLVKGSGKKRGHSTVASFFVWLKENGGTYYDPKAFGLEAFNWNLTENDFAPSENEKIMASLGLSSDTLVAQEPRSASPKLETEEASNDRPKILFSELLARAKSNKSQESIELSAAFRKLMQSRSISDIEFDPYSEY